MNPRNSNLGTLAASSRDFDFLFGDWKVHNRWLTRRLAGSHEWTEFEATSRCSPLPGGLGNQDIYRTDHWPGFVGLTLRFYDPKTGLWSIRWVDNRTAPGVLQPPVVGSFSDGVGVFEGSDRFECKPVTVRFVWRALGRASARWEQAFTADGGKTWETNWEMDFTRVGEEVR